MLIPFRHVSRIAYIRIQMKNFEIINTVKYKAKGDNKCRIYTLRVTSQRHQTIEKKTACKVLVNLK